MMVNIKVMVIWILFTSQKWNEWNQLDLKCYFNFFILWIWNHWKKDRSCFIVKAKHGASHLRKLLSSIMKTLINLTSVNSIDTWPWVFANTDTILCWPYQNFRKISLNFFHEDFRGNYLRYLKPKKRFLRESNFL